MEIVLFEPEIPQNTGNIVRTCKATNSKLTLVKPLGFSTSNRALKRAGLDYWVGVDVNIISDLSQYLIEENRPFYFFSSKVDRPFTKVDYESDAMLIFGSETKGLPPDYFTKWLDHFVTIPMSKEARCLNLSNSAAIAIYEAMRQQSFASIN